MAIVDGQPHIVPIDLGWNGKRVNFRNYPEFEFSMDTELYDYISDHLNGLDPAEAEKQRNKLIDQWVNQGRQRFGNVKPYYRHEGVKQIMSALRHGEVLHLSPDMDFGPDESLFVPFMGVNAATVPSLSRFARLGRAPVFSLVTRMTTQGYEMSLSNVWKDFPTEDVAADTLRMNLELEAAVRRSPAQYYWVHKRFKTRPEGEASVYK